MKSVVLTREIEWPWILLAHGPFFESLSSTEQRPFGAAVWGQVLTSGESTMIPESQLEPVATLPDLEAWLLARPLPRIVLAVWLDGMGWV